MNQAGSLDHVGVVGRDLGALAEAFEAVGFRPTPVARHPGGRTANRCIMLRHGYIELLATVDGGTSATLERFLAHHAGAHTLAFGIDDEAAVLDRLRLAGISAPDATETERAVSDSDPDGPRARFILITPPDRPEGRFHLVRHLTPQALWQEHFLHHPNNAEALVEAILLSPAPAETAAALSLMAGRPVVPDRAGGYALDLPEGQVRVLPESTGLLAGRTAPPAPCIAGLTIRTADGNSALRQVLTRHGKSHATDGAAIVTEVAGVVLRFVG